MMTKIIISIDDSRHQSLEGAVVNFGTIGAGTVAQAIAGHLVAAGHKVTPSNSRGPDTLLDVVTRLGPLASAATVEEAAAADVVFLAVMWPQVGAALAALPPWVSARFIA